MTSIIESNDSNSNRASQRVLSGGAYSQTLSRGLAVLEVLAATDHPLTSNEVAKELKLNRSVAYRLLHTLEAHDLVMIGIDGRFTLGLSLVSLARKVQSDLRMSAYPVLKDLASETGGTAILNAVDGEEVIILLSVEPPNAEVRLSLREGVRRPLYKGSPGIAILSGRPRKPNEDPLVTNARNLGYATSQGVLEVGAHGVSAPVPTNFGGSQYAVTALFFSEHLINESDIGKKVQTAAKKVAFLT